MILSFIKQVTKEFDNQINELRYSISQGAVEDFVTYKAQCARLQGYQEALDSFKRVAEKYLNDDEIEEIS